MAPTIRLNDAEHPGDAEVAEAEFLIPTEDFGRDREKPSICEFKTKDGEVDNSNTLYVRKLFLYLLALFLVLVHLVACTSYLIYKVVLYSRYPREVLRAPWLVIIFILECTYFFATLIAAVDHSLPPSKRPDIQLDGHYYPTVHIFLPCCKEPTDIPQDSVLAALALDYPKDRFKVFVLDDGGDDDLKAFCEAMQVETGGQVVYLRRQKIPGKPHHFKCGNLNFGLEHSNSEYVVIQDADMILHPNFLRKLLPHIVNSPNIAFVQIPQSFYNLPIGDPLNDSCVQGYDKVLVHRDTLGCATCIGTGALFRRKNLNEIGGFQPQSVTEDTTTAYALFREGYRSVYLDEKLQIGLSPWTFEGYIKQRTRWGQGAMQQFRSTWRAMLGKDSKLNFVLKIFYFWHTGFYFMSFVNVILVAILFFTLLLRLDIHIGTDEEGRKLLETLSYNLIFWRLSWFATWLEVPQSLQSRNREESTFWWMSPFFCKMIFQSIFSYSSTFNFVPTSTIDRNAAKGSQSELMKQLSQLKHVKFHIIFTIVTMTVIIGRLYLLATRYGFDDCRESFNVFGVGYFLFTTCAHMMLPVLFILWPTGFNPSHRQSLLQYCKGVPSFTAADCSPKWYWSVIFYEMGSYATLIFWSIVLFSLKFGFDKQFCKNESLRG